MAYELNFSNTVQLEGSTVFSSTVLSPNSLLGAEFTFQTTNASQTQPINFTYAAVDASNGVQCIVVRSDVTASVQFKDSGGSAVGSAITCPENSTVIGARSDANTSIPFNFAIPTSGNAVTQVTVTKSGSTFLSGDVTIWVYYNRANT